MKTRVIAIILAVLMLCGVSPVKGDIVELDLFGLGCPAEFDFDSPYWQSDFDLGVEFVEISSVYIDWSGEITAEVVAPVGQPDKASPIDALFVVTLYESDPHDYFGREYVQAGQRTYPIPETFELQSVFTNGDWLALLDGKGNIEIGLYGISLPGDLITIEYPYGQLDSAILVLEGTLIPEPASILLLIVGILGVRTRIKKVEIL